jgi:hypothetical protein
MFKTCIPIKNEHKDRIIALLNEIEITAEKKGQKFNWYLQKSNIKNADHVIVVESQTEEQAHKRGLLITKRYAKDLKLYYWIKKTEATR